MTGLWKTTVIIWSAEEPHGLEISKLAQEAESGGSYCSVRKDEFMKRPKMDPDWDGTEVFEAALADLEDFERNR